MKDLPLPRCVGGDKKLTPQLLNRLNRTFLGGRVMLTRPFSGSTPAQKLAAAIKAMGKPLARKAA